jgi:hypothetical protein
MLHHAQHELIARLDTGRKIGRGDQIDRFRAAFGENIV